MTTRATLKDVFEFPLILAVKDDQSFEAALNSKCKVLFLLYGDICSLPSHVQKAKDHGKIVFVHTDLINGLAAHEAALDYICQNTEVDGIISTKFRLLKQAKKYPLMTILRVFMLDSMALDNCFNNIDHSQPDMVEILPGIATKSFSLIKEHTNVPVIAGGLIRTKEDIVEAIKAGASAVSTSSLLLCEQCTK